MSPPTMVRLAGVLAWLAVACLPLAIVVGSIPVQNVRGEVDQEASEAERRRTGDRDAVVIDDGDVVLQDCGAPLVYLATARLDEEFQAGGPENLSEEQARYANEHGCRERVADRLKPVAGLLAGFVVLGLAALVLTLVGRSRAKGAWVRSAIDQHSTS